jgi:phosphoglycolate phosphatase
VSGRTFPLYVFDLDGTLVDSLRDLADSANALLVSCGGAALERDAVAKMIGEGVGTLVARVFEAGGVPKPPDAIERFLDIYDGRLLEHTRPYDGIDAVLDALAPQSRLAVLTNKPRSATLRILAGLGLAKYFDETAIVGGDGPLPRKPEPAGLHRLASQAGVRPDAALLVGDSAIDWQTARNAGTQICLARYGFGFRSMALDALDGTEWLIDTPRALLAL